MKHKLLTLLIAIMASLGTMFAQSGPCGDNLTWNLTNGVLTISGTGAMTDYTSSSKAPWFTYSNSINSVVIGDGVTSIGKWAFSNCNGMTSATIGNSVASIGDYAFFECSALTSTGIPNSVTTIGNSAFIRCTSLESVVIPGSVTRFGNYAFYQCNSLSSVVIIYGVTSIGTHAFDECSNLASVSLPNSITSIEEASFRNCSSLTSMTIPSNVISIGESAFQSCTSLTSVSIPNSVTSIGNSAFAGDWVLTSIELPNSLTSIGESAFGGCRVITSITNYATVPQVITASTFNNLNKYACTLYVPAESVEAYKAADIWKEFPHIQAIDSTEKFHYATLADIYNMAADSTFTLGAFDVVYIPDFQSGSNMYIKDSTGSCVIYKVNYGLQAGDHVEAGLQGKISIYNGLHEVIPITAKEDLTITHGEAPAPIVATEAPSLNNASQYVVYEGVLFATDTAFVKGRRHAVPGTWNGQTITFYNQYYIGATLSANKTYNITAVNTIYRTTPQAYPLAVEEVSPAPCVIASGTCGAQGDNLTWTLTCDSVLTISGTGAMVDYSINNPAPWYSHVLSVKAVVVNEGVTGIGQCAFMDCSGLTSVAISNSVTSIGGGAFARCASLTSVTIPNSVTSIGENAFQSCSSLTSVTIPNSVTIIKGFAFNGCHSLTNIDIPNSVTIIVAGAFSDCEKLTSINVETDNPNYCSADGVLFNKNKTSLVQYPSGKQGVYTIPAGVTKIISHAFRWSTGLTSVEIPNSVTSIREGAFVGCTALTSVEIPNSVASIGRQTFYYCSSLNSVKIPNSVTSIDEYAFQECNSLTSFTNYATNPQTINANVFVGTEISNCTLYVPAESIALYQAADVWKDFGNILAIEDTPSHEIDRTGTCGDNNALTWTYDPETKTLTIYGNGTLNSNYTFGLEAPAEIEQLIIAEGVTSIGDSAFRNMSTLQTMQLPSSLKTIGAKAFENCIDLSSIYNYRERPCLVNATAFDGVNKFDCTLYVLEGSVDMYKSSISDWRDFYFILPISTTTVTEPVSDVTVEPHDNAATVTWPTQDNAVTYAIEISKDGVVFCRLTFNANGQLTGIAFAPSRDGSHNAPAALMTVNGLQFTVTGLNSNTKYSYSVTAKDGNDVPVATYSGEFFTTGEGIATAVDNTTADSKATKLLLNGQILILRGEKEYTIMGQKVK